MCPMGQPLKRRVPDDARHLFEMFSVFVERFRPQPQWVLAIVEEVRRKSRGGRLARVQGLMMFGAGSVGGSFMKHKTATLG